MIIDFLMFTIRLSPMEWSLISFFTSRPFAKQWSLISLSHQDPLQWNGHWFSYVYIKILCKAMVINFCHIKTLSNGMVIDFLMFTSRPSPKEWSLILLCLHRGPLRGNGHWFICSIDIFFVGMVTDFLTYGPSLWDWLNLSLGSGPSKRSKI